MPVRVLCVDDDSYLTDLLRYALGRDGYTVDVAGTGAEALRMAQASPPDIVLLDRTLPDIDGLALCGQFRRTLHLPVIMLTASSADTDAAKGFESGADDYIGKPFSMQILGYRIRAVLRRSAQLGAPGGPIRATYRLGTGTFQAERHEVAGRLGRVQLTPTQGKILRRHDHVQRQDRLRRADRPRHAEQHRRVLSGASARSGTRRNPGLITCAPDGNPGL